MTSVARGPSVAFAYAWWLTGDEDSAARALRAAVTDAPPNGDDPFAGLLGAVRAAAIAEPTMCPASELALLHDGAGLPLDLAAALVGLDLEEARVGLAHGRLEALTTSVTEPFNHPERLGGLALGNPPDVAHARQCPDCEQAHDLLLEGRRELRALQAPDPPAEVLDLVPPVLEPRPGAVEESPPPRRRLLPWLLAAGAVALGVAALVVAVGRPAALPEPVPEAGPPVAAPAVPAEEAEAPDLTGPFHIEAAGLLLQGASEPASGAHLDPSEAVRLVVRYRGAADGVVVVGHWTVDTEPYRSLRVVLTGARSAHVFGAQVPDGGWPAGDHQILLTVDGEVAAAVDFTVG